MSAPWPSLFSASFPLVACGLGGLGYAGLVFRRAVRQTAYKPVWDDWVWYTILPCGIYATLAAAAFLLPTSNSVAPFVIGAAALGLLFIGIRNAWDTVTHIVVGSSSHPEGTSSDKEP